MMRPEWNTAVYLCKDPVDMRKSIDGLALLVQDSLELNPFQQAVFVFCNRQRDKIKILGWERNGFVLWYKRLEKERFKWPERFSGSQITLNGQQLHWLLDGYDLNVMKPHRSLSFDCVG